MFINYHEKNPCNPISSKYLHTCSLPTSSFSLPKRKAIKGMKTSHQNQALPKAQHSTAEGSSMHAQPRCLWLKLQPWFSWTENSRSQRREGGQRRFCLQPGVSIHPASTHLYPWTCQTECPGDQHLWLGHWVPLLAPRGSRGGVGWWGGVMPSMALGTKGHSTPASRDGPRSGMCMASSSMQHTALLTWSAAAIISYI